MTATKQGILSDLKRFNDSRKGKMIVCFEGEPEPPHSKNDILIVFDEEDKVIF